jgi:hypothetical protein
MKIEAATRLKATEVDAGWFDALSDVAKKAYKRLHPNSKVGKGSKSNPDRIKHAEEMHKKHKENYNKIKNSGGDERSDSEWQKHDKALENLEKSRDRLKRLKGK